MLLIHRESIGAQPNKVTPGPRLSNAADAWPALDFCFLNRPARMIRKCDKYFCNVFAGIQTARPKRAAMASCRAPDRFGHEIQATQFPQPQQRSSLMNSIIYLVGAVVIILAVLSFFGLR